MRTSKRPISELSIDRVTISVPRGMGQLIRMIAKDSDLDSSKLLRRSLDLYVKKNEGEINKSILDEYWRFRNRYAD